MRDTADAGEVDHQGREKPDDLLLLALRKNARAYVSALRRTRPLAAASQRHIDRMLQWAVALMGAGLLAIPTLLETACEIKRSPFPVWLAAPWLAGVVVALLGRIAGGFHRDADNFHFVRKWQSMETLLLREPDFDTLSKWFFEIMNDRDSDLARDLRKVKRLSWIVDMTYYASTILLVGGLLVVFWFAARC